MKRFFRYVAMLLALLLIMSVAVACNGQDDKDEHKETHKETEREPEHSTEQQLTDEEREQLKAQMSEAIMQSLSEIEPSTEQDTQENTTAAPGEGTTTDYGNFVEGLLGALGGLGNGDYNYFEIIMEVLDHYIGSNSTSEFIKGLIKSWIENKLAQNQQTTEPQTGEIDTSIPGDLGQSLQEYLAIKTANAVADAIANRIRDLMGELMSETVFESIRESVYNSVYNAMIDDNGYMDSLLNEMIPGYGQLGGILGGLGQ